MPSMNRVSLIGNLTRDPESRQIPSGATVCSCRLAINETYTDRDGNKVENPCFVDLELWEKTAENAMKFLHKGSLLLIEGRLQYDEWKAEDGQTRSRLKVRGDRIQFLDRAPAGAKGNGDGAEARDDRDDRRAAPPPARSNGPSRPMPARETARR